LQGGYCLKFFSIEFHPKLRRFVLVLLSTLAPTKEILRARWLCAQNWGKIGIADKRTNAFSDNVDDVPPAVNAINLVGFEIEEESDRFSRNQTEPNDEQPLTQVVSLIS
jgi:hypothetical protein